MKQLPGAGCRLGALLVLFAGGSLALFSCARSARHSAGQVLATPTNLVLVTIDTLRADALGFYGNQKVETPNLDRLAGAGLVFDSAHASNVVTLAPPVTLGKQGVSTSVRKHAI